MSNTARVEAEKLEQPLRLRCSRLVFLTRELKEKKKHVLGKNPPLKYTCDEGK